MSSEPVRILAEESIMMTDSGFSSCSFNITTVWARISDAVTTIRIWQITSRMLRNLLIGILRFLNLRLNLHMNVLEISFCWKFGLIM